MPQQLPGARISTLEDYLTCMVLHFTQFQSKGTITNDI